MSSHSAIRNPIPVSPDAVFSSAKGNTPGMQDSDAFFSHFLNRLAACVMRFNEIPVNSRHAAC
jgi:hypothetical protein